jgi:hypothetical protein
MVPEARLLQAFLTTHLRIRTFAEQHPECDKMTTTCTVVVVKEQQFWLVHSDLHPLPNRLFRTFRATDTFLQNFLSEGWLSERVQENQLTLIAQLSTESAEEPPNRVRHIHPQFHMRLRRTPDLEAERRRTCSGSSTAPLS